jgi:hypothetical protein
VFLFSDGEPSLGKLKPEELAAISNDYKEKYNIYTSCYGIGIEFDEKMMQAISDAGGGQCNKKNMICFSFFFQDFYIDKPEKIPDLVREGVEGLISVVGTEAFLSIDCQPAITKVKKIYGNPAQIRDSGIEIGNLIKKSDFPFAYIKLTSQISFKSLLNSKLILHTKNQILLPQ